MAIVVVTSVVVGDVVNAVTAVVFVAIAVTADLIK